MTTTHDPRAAAGISDAAARAKTGRGWDGWFALLDSFDVRTHDHTAAAHHLAAVHNAPDWWCQMIVVAYERARGLRDKHQKPDGYETSASKTVPVPLATLSAAWTDDSLRARWLPDPLIIRKTTPNRSVRAARADGTDVSVNFYSKGDSKSQVAIQHSKLPDAAAVVESKAYRQNALNRLTAVLMRDTR